MAMMPTYPFMAAHSAGSSGLRTSPGARREFRLLARRDSVQTL